MTIIKRRINGYGPYAYRVTWIPDEQTHKWEYLGPVGAIDPDDITSEEREELGQSALASFRDLPEGDFTNLEVANATREELIERFGPSVLFVRDDRRLTEVTLSADAPQAAVSLVTGRAADDRRDSDGPGQLPLTDAERSRIDFSEGYASVPHAMTAKSAIQNAGVDDWTAIYDAQIEDPAAFEEIAQNNRESIQGERLDNDSEDSQLGSISLEEADSRAERQAIQGARDGYDEARDVLRTEYGYTETDVQEAIA